MQKLNEYGAGMKRKSRVIEVKKKAAIVEDINGDIAEIKFDSIICTTGYEPDLSFYMQVKDYAEDVYIIGDALKPAGLRQTVHRAYQIALNIM
jgi:hypothetical protein